MISVRTTIILIFTFSTVASTTHSVFALSGTVCSPTESDVEGPYYVPEAPFRTQIAAPDEPGEHVVIKGTVVRTDCKTPVKDALIEIWQTDSQGKYHYQKEGYRLRGQLRTDSKGLYEFRSIKPGRYRIMHGFRPAHIHFKISHPDYETVITQLYFHGDPYLWPNDACGSACKSNDSGRIIKLEPHKRGNATSLKGTFTIILKPNK